MTAEDLRAWQAHMKYGYAQACAALGVGSSTYARMLSGEAKIDLRTALACTFLTASLATPALAKEAPAEPATPNFLVIVVE